MWSQGPRPEVTMYDPRFGERFGAGRGLSNPSLHCTSSRRTCVSPGLCPVSKDAKGGHPGDHSEAPTLLCVARYRMFIRLSSTVGCRRCYNPMVHVLPSALHGESGFTAVQDLKTAKHFCQRPVVSNLSPPHNAHEAGMAESIVLASQVKD